MLGLETQHCSNISAASHPDVIQVVKTHASWQQRQGSGGSWKPWGHRCDALAELLPSDPVAACFAMQQPNYYGCLRM